MMSRKLAPREHPVGIAKGISAIQRSRARLVRRAAHARKTAFFSDVVSFHSLFHVFFHVVLISAGVVWQRTWHVPQQVTALQTPEGDQPTPPYC
jgi:hypothetical protein